MLFPLLQDVTRYREMTWKTVVTAIITAVVGAFAGAIIALVIK